MDKWNLYAFCLPWMIFLFWGILGYAALSILRTQRNSLQNLLIAPTVGFAMTLVATFLLNRLGMPVKNFATLLTIILLILSCIIFYWTKPIFCWRYYLPFSCIFLLSLYLSGRPLLEFGFDWVSFSNHDMTYYCNGAQRFLYHGFFELPKVNDLVHGRDYNLFSWFANVLIMIRCGSEMILAWLSALLHMNPLRVFMPLILALSLTLISAAGGLIYQSNQWRLAALTVCLLLACSAMTTLGTLYQLIGQVGGISLLIVNAILLLQPYAHHQKYTVLRQSILINITVFAFLIQYPETSPFLALAFILYFVIMAIRGMKPTRSFWRVLSLSLVMSIVLINIYWINIISFTILNILYQAVNQNIPSTIFPYFLIPSGIANFWGIIPIPLLPERPWLDVAIILGASLFVLTIILTVMQMIKGYTAATIATVMMLLGIFLSKNHNGFGLFKLTMYIQPFILCVIAAALFELIRQHKLRCIFVSLFAIMGLGAQYFYVNCSRGAIGSMFVELPNASRLHLLTEIEKISNQISSSAPIVADAANPVLKSMLKTYLIGKESTFLTSDHVGYFTVPIIPPFPSSILVHAKELSEAVQQSKITLNFNLQDAADEKLVTAFRKSLIQHNNHSMVLIVTPQREMFNHRLFSKIGCVDDSASTSANLVAMPINQIVNYLAFINSTLGAYHYSNSKGGENISINNHEKDLFFKNQVMAGIGRYLLFRIINPSPKTRLVLNITTTLNHDKNNQLPHAVVVGYKRFPLALLGRGSARIFSANIIPQLIEHDPYILLDMGIKGKRFFIERHGLMNLYGKDIFLDRRNLVGFVRDISLISENDYFKLNAPSSLNNFPSDLANPDLEYSGIYEDGWISEAAFFNLTQPHDNALLNISGVFPKIDAKISSSQVTVYVDGKKMIVSKLSHGNFNIQLPIPHKKNKRRIEVHFSQIQNLPNNDGRPVAAKIEFIGFKKNYS